MVTDPQTHTHTHTHTQTNKQTHRHDRLQYTAPQLARSVNGLVDIPFDKFLNFANSNSTRGHPLKLSYSDSRINARSHSFLYVLIHYGSVCQFILNTCTNCSIVHLYFGQVCNYLYDLQLSHGSKHVHQQ